MYLLPYSMSVGSACTQQHDDKRNIKETLGAHCNNTTETLAVTGMNVCAVKINKQALTESIGL